jgi:hypothetical protein
MLWHINDAADYTKLSRILEIPAISTSLPSVAVGVPAGKQLASAL